MQYRLAGVGVVSFEELNARFSAYLNAGAPKPILEGSPEEKQAALDRLDSQGDSQMRLFVEQYRRLISGDKE